jgi:hypothetical protein
MNTQQHLEKLLTEVDLILKTDLVVQRKYYFEGARDYLLTLKRISQEPETQTRHYRTKKSANKNEQEMDT